MRKTLPATAWNLHKKAYRADPNTRQITSWYSLTENQYDSVYCTKKKKPQKARRQAERSNISVLLRALIHPSKLIFYFTEIQYKREGLVAMHIPSKLTERNSNLNYTNIMHFIHFCPPFKNNYFLLFFSAYCSCDALSKLNYTCSFKSAKKMNEIDYLLYRKGKYSEWQNRSAHSYSRGLLNRTKYKST